MPGGEKGDNKREMRVSAITTPSGVQVLPEPARPRLDADRSIDPQRYSVAVVHTAFIEHGDLTASVNLSEAVVPGDWPSLPRRCRSGSNYYLGGFQRDVWVL
jgi:hypothetical protein